MTIRHEQRSRVARLVVLAATALAVELIYVFVISAGRFSHWPAITSYLNNLAEGFRQGHLHLATEPPAALVAKPNPLDPENFQYWLWDASLYGGHYYLYWGPMPALLLAAFKVVFRVSSVLGDELVVFWLTSLQLLAGTLFVERAGRRLFHELPLVLEVTAILVVGLANPTLYNLARPAIYEAAIVGGHAFLLLGLVFAFDAISDATRVRTSAIAAGACWSGALACRISLAPEVALLVVTTALFAGGGRPYRVRRAVKMLASIGIPLALGLLALFGYNRLRFGAWFEFGRKYQLTWIVSEAGPRNIVPNIYAYLLRPLTLSCRFPFVFALQDMGPRAFPSWYHLPAGYFVYEPVAGVLPGLSWCWFAPVAMVGAWLYWRGRGGAVEGMEPSGRAVSPSALPWAVVATAVGTTAGIFPALAIPSATNRYLGDVAGMLALLGALGVFTAVEALRTRAWARNLVGAAALLLALLSVGVGFGLGIKGQYTHFETNNPSLYQRLVRGLSICRGAIPPEPK